MEHLDSDAKQWLSRALGAPFKASKHIHSHQDEVYKIETPSNSYYLKISKSLRAENDNLKKLKKILNVPEVIVFYDADENDYLLISELPGKNLVELIGEWSDVAIVDKFAEAIRQLHSLDAAKIFPEANAKDVLLHGDMALPNIIISAQGQTGYIDFGQMSFGPPELDLADAIWSLQRNIGPDYGELFLKKYGPVVVTPKIEKALKFRYQPPENEQ
jgi:aminoglycoside phosphotransferase